VLAYTCSSLFKIVYGMAVDAILHSFLLDEELAKKNGSSSMCTPKHLRNFLE